MPEVEFAHEPISIFYFNEPNDPKFQDQWNLEAVNALAAWDITHGSNTIKIGIVDTGTDQDHEDLLDKIAGGDGIEGVLKHHGTWVAGVAGAKTDNGKGIASLGWDITLYTYGGYENVGDESFAVEDISQATEDGVDVINMSWGTFRQGTLGDISPECPFNRQKWANAAIIPHSYPEIDSVITNAIAQGVISIAGTGNRSPNSGVQPYSVLCDPTLIPFDNYPAQQPADVVAVSGTELVNQVEQFNDDWNYGSFVDISAPGKAIWTTDFGGDYINVNGTLFSAPLVSALAALLRSVNSTLTVSQVEDIITSTADQIDPSNCDGSPIYDGNGWNPCLGYGLINAHAAVLQALDDLPNRTSNLATATAHNSGRRIVRDGSGNYHLVYQAGNQVFYAQYSSTGSWSSDVRLSDGAGQYNYPSIAQRSNNLYVTWQKKTSSSHDIYFHKSTDGGSNWSGQVVDTNVGSSDPLPVIASPSASNLDIVYRAGGYIRSKHSATDGASWSTFAITGTTLNSPSVAPGKTPWNASATVLAYATNDIPNASDIKAHYYFNGWTSEKNLSSGLPSEFSQHARPSIAYSGDYTQNKTHVAWDAYNSFRSARVILHKVLSSWNNPRAYSELYYQTQDNPSITGLDGATAGMAFQRNSSSIIRAEYTGLYWLTYYETSGKYPSISVGNTQAKYVYTSSSAAPYDVVLGAMTLSKSSPQPLAYSRAVGLVDEKSGASVNIIVEDFLVKDKDGSMSQVGFAPAPADSIELSIVEALAALASEQFAVPIDADSLIVVYSLVSDKASGLKQADNPVQIQIKTKTIGAGLREQRFPDLIIASDSPVAQSKLRMSVAAKAFNAGEAIVFSMELTNQKEAGLTVSLGHLYDLSGKGTAAKQLQANYKTNQPGEFNLSLDNYPNPFNPETTIHYDIPEAAQVEITIYNLLGKKVRTLVNRVQTAGKYNIRWDGKNGAGQNVASGVYLAKIKAGTQYRTIKMTLVR